jgi:hypothetical protein
MSKKIAIVGAPIMVIALSPTPIAFHISQTSAGAMFRENFAESSGIPLPRATAHNHS